MSSLKKTDHFYLIDGSGYIFRAYYALPPLSRKSDGLPTGAVSGFCSMLFKLLEDSRSDDSINKPTHFAVIFDSARKNFRNEIGKDKLYKNAGSNHPHQFHIEILAELGVIGYLSFFIFFVFNLYFSIKYFLRNKDLIQLSALLFVFCSLIPLLPSGSFFSTFGASIFWLNFALMLPKNN